MAENEVETPTPSAPLISEQASRLLLDAAVDYAIYMLDPQGRVMTWNPGAQAIKGYTPEEVIGENFTRFFTPEDRAAGLPQRALDTARETGRFESEGWRLRKDGSRFWALAVLDAIHGDDGQVIGFAKITRDMTERREAQERLAASERQFRLLVTGVTDYALYMLDPDGIVTNWNAGAERIKGFRADEVVGRHFSQFYTPEDRDAGLPQLALETARETGRWEAEGWRLRKDGARFWANAVLDAIRDEDGQLVGFAKITRDMSDRRAAEESLRASERQFRMLVTGVTDYALYMLDPDGIVTNWNTGAETIKGYQAEEAVGQHFSVFYTKEDRDAGLPRIALETAARTGRFESEGWRVRKDGSRFWANAVLDAIRDDDGQLVGFAKITRDISERVEQERRLEETREQLFQSQKMEAIGQLTGGVAHDFNNLLTVIVGGVDMALRKSHDPERVRSLLSAVAEAASRGASLTRQLLAFSRRQSLTPEPIALDEMLPGFIDLLERSLGSELEVMLEVDPDTTVHADLRQLELALLHVCLNARDAMPAGGRIDIRVGHEQLNQGPRGLNGDFVTISVADTGAGIAPELKERVFEPFFTTKEVGRGTGLGLSQAYGFAQQSGGTIRLDSAPGLGATVTFVLPQSSAAPASPLSTLHLGKDDLKGRSILIVEDDLRVADLACTLLREAGATVTHAANANAALDRLRAGRFDLVFSDIVMPGKSGVELAREICKSWPGTPILLTTGYGGANATSTEFRTLPKPYAPEELTRAVAERLRNAG